jgi:hypothetical protein
MGTNKTLYGLMAFGPLGLIVASIAGIFLMVFSEMDRHSPEPPAGFFVFVGLIFLASILSIISLIMYIIHISKNTRLDDGSRIGWILGMVFAHGIVAIVYFFVHIANEPAPSPYSSEPTKGPWN